MRESVTLIIYRLIQSLCNSLCPNLVVVYYIMLPIVTFVAMVTTHDIFSLACSNVALISKIKFLSASVLHSNSLRRN